MLRFSHALLLGLLVSGSWLACGEKLNPKRDFPTGTAGTTGDAGGSEAGATATVSYAQVIAPMMKASCAVSSCHNSSDKTLGYAFDTYDGLKKDIAAANASIQDKTMPISPGADMSDAQRKTFQDWVTQGALNN